MLRCFLLIGCCHGCGASGQWLLWRFLWTTFDGHMRTLRYCHGVRWRHYINGAGGLGRNRGLIWEWDPTWKQWDLFEWFMMFICSKHILHYHRGNYWNMCIVLLFGSSILCQLLSFDVFYFNFLFQWSSINLYFVGAILHVYIYICFYTHDMYIFAFLSEGYIYFFWWRAGVFFGGEFRGVSSNVLLKQIPEKKKKKTCENWISRWWFQIFVYFHPYLGKIPILIITRRAP